MAKKQIESSETGNWNNAKRYSDSKIQGILEVVDEYEDVAEFGYKNMKDKPNITTNELIKIKMESFRFLVHKLIQITRNSEFAIVNNRDDFLRYQKQLLIIYNVINPTGYRTVRINNEEYSALLQKVQEIKAKINIPLNKNSLIFMNKIEYNAKERKDQALARFKEP